MESKKVENSLELIDTEEDFMNKTSLAQELGISNKWDLMKQKVVYNKERHHSSEEATYIMENISPITHLTEG